MPLDDVGLPTLPDFKPLSVCAQAKCEYCGRYGPLGPCEGCGAPTRPVRRIDVTQFGDQRPRYLEVWE
jgi:hypothetical protein